MIVSTSHRVCTMKNIDFTDFFNVFLSGATILGAFAFCFNFFVIPLYRADGCSGTVSLIAVAIHAWHQEKAT